MATSGGGPQSPVETDPKKRFFRYFQHEITALQEQMERLRTTSWSGGERNDAIDHCRAGINRLSQEVKDASSYVPTYDQRTYADAIKALQEKLEDTLKQSAPPKKFQFKTARKNNSAISITDAAEMAQQNKLRVPGYQSDTSNASSSFAPTPLDKLSPTEEKTEEELIGNKSSEAKSEDEGPATAIRKLSFSDATSITVSNHNKIHILVPTSATHATSSGTVSSIRHSVIDLSPPTRKGGPFAGLTLKNIKESLIVCGHVSGAAHITGVENSVIITSCRQFRMHGSKNVDVYLHCSSRPIIEDCEEIRFAPLPNAYTTSSISKSQNQWDQIDDFKWLKSEPSPHFSLLAVADRIKEEVWKNVVPGGHKIDVDDILRAVTILQ